jgi:predicted neuraminidase
MTEEPRLAPSPPPPPHVWSALTVVAITVLGTLIVAGIVQVIGLFAVGAFKPGAKDFDLTAALQRLIDQPWGPAALMLPGQITMLAAALAGRDSRHARRQSVSRMLAPRSARWRKQARRTSIIPIHATSRAYDRRLWRLSRERRAAFQYMNRTRLPLLAVILLSISTTARAGETAAVLTREFVYETAPFPECHASTIVETPAGLVCAWFGGTREKHPDVGIWVARHEDGKWTEPVEAANGLQADGTRHPTWNPVLFRPKDGPLLLFYKIGPTPETWWGMLRTSPDNGKSWSEAARLPAGILGPIKNKPVQLADGTILCPTSTETATKPSVWRVHFEITRDLGKTWTKVAPAPSGEPPIDAIQPSVLFLGGEKLLALGRTRQDRIFEVASNDNGRTWGAMKLGALPNNNSGIDAVTLADGTHVLVYNHVGGISGRWGGKRTPLNVAVSKDGRDWQAALVLESEPGEFSYPAVIQTRDGRLHFTYTWNRKKICHVIVDLTKLEPKPIVNATWPKSE